MDQSLISTSATPKGVVATLLAALERSHALACAALLALSLLLFLPGFFGLPPMDRDEPRFAQASKQMLETRDFVAIRFQDEARNKKPVGIYWLQAASVALAEHLGFDAARTTISVYRIPSLIGASLVVLLTYWAGLAWLERRYALIAAALMAATVLLGVEARLAKTDAVLTATVVAAMGALARIWAARLTQERSLAKEPFILWLALAAGALIKGPITLMVVGLAALALSIKQGASKREYWRWLKPLADWRAIGLAILVVAPWFVAIAVETHGAFFSEAVGGDMLGKVAGAREAHGAPPGSYLVASLVTLWPIVPLAVIAVPIAWRWRREDEVAFLLAWLVPCWLVFEAVPTKLPHYVLPLYPAIALLVAFIAQRGSLRLDRSWKRIAAILLPLLPVAIALAIPYATLLYGDRTELVGAGVVGLGAVIAAAAAFLLMRARVAPAAAGAALAALFLTFGVYRLTIPHLQAFMLSPRLAATLATSPCRPNAIATAGFNEPSLVFLTRTDLNLTDGAAAARFMVGPGCRAAFVDIRQEGQFSQSLAALGIAPHPIGRVFGVNLNGGRHLDIGVYVNGG
ncbi:4-amino-4-deoxy-L-arabinose transferase [Rhizobiales bacterium GAS191]|nr:4-amino-4-deoxy-L-arabinose transferase [Rhizobiales bacterium GAS191]